MAKLTKESFIESLESMTILEIKELLDALKETYGIDPTAVAVAAPAGGAAADAAPSEVTVVLTSAGDKKIAVVKAVKEITGLILKDAKDLVDNVPSNIKEGVSPEDAQAIKAQLEAEGASVEIK